MCLSENEIFALGKFSLVSGNNHFLWSRHLDLLEESWLVSKPEKANKRNQHQGLEVTDLWGRSLNCKKIFCSEAWPTLGGFEASISHRTAANCTPPDTVQNERVSVFRVWIGPISMSPFKSEKSSRKLNDITSPCTKILFGPLSLWMRSCHLSPQAAISMICQCQGGGWRPKRLMAMLELSSQAGSGQRNICFHHRQNCELNEHFNSLTLHPWRGLGWDQQCGRAGRRWVACTGHRF